ncbi:MAG: phosphoribosylformylglycinamidine synthase subunit PurS [Deltaproteobacteria bacterium]|jgi:phosphoribosylformylglycinamidine synthase|nr:phosphoribosylformylglycinamidine synthase subunit PurS [Deltaproteobacteria bacterium]
MKYKVIVRVVLKPSVLDPQGAAIERALTAMGNKGIDSVRVGKIIEIVLEGPDEKTVFDKVNIWSDELLANPNMETYSLIVEPIA